MKAGEITTNGVAAGEVAAKVYYDGRYYSGRDYNGERSCSERDYSERDCNDKRSYGERGFCGRRNGESILRQVKLRRAILRRKHATATRLLQAEFSAKVYCSGEALGEAKMNCGRRKGRSLV